jgi:hypothetical protein
MAASAGWPRLAACTVPARRHWSPRVLAVLPTRARLPYAVLRLRDRARFPVSGVTLRVRPSWLVSPSVCLCPATGLERKKVTPDGLTSHYRRDTRVEQAESNCAMELHGNCCAASAQAVVDGEARSGAAKGNAQLSLQPHGILDADEV